MKFTTENNTENENIEEKLRERYKECIEKSLIDGLIDLGNAAKKTEGIFGKEMYVLALSNAMRIGMKINKSDVCEYIIESVEEDELLDAKIEYYEHIGDYLKCVFFINKLLKKENSKLGIKKREKLRQKYGMKVQKEEKKKTMKISLWSDVYELVWILFMVLYKGEDKSISGIDIVDDSDDKMEQEEEKEKYSDDLFSVSKDFSFSENKDYVFQMPENMSLSECIVAVLNKVSLVWKNDLFLMDQKYSMYLGYLTLLDYIQINMLNENIALFTSKHISMSRMSGALRSFPNLDINRIICRVEKKITIWLWKNKNYFPQYLKIENILFSDSEMLLYNALCGYLMDPLENNTIVSVVQENPFFDAKSSPILTKVLEKAWSVSDFSVFLICAMFLETMSPKHILLVFPYASSLAQSFCLTRMFYTDTLSIDQKIALFASMHLPTKEMFTYNQVVNLLLYSPPNTHLPFFSHFIRPKSLLVSSTVYDVCNHTKINLSHHTLVRSADLIKKYIRHPQRMYMAPLTETNPIFSKILPVILHRKEHEFALAINPFSTITIIDYIKHLYAQMHLPVKKDDHLFIYDSCKKTSNLIILSQYHISFLENPESLQSILSEGLSVFLSLEEVFKCKKNKHFKNIYLPKQSMGSLCKSLNSIRSLTKTTQKPTLDTILYDLWRININPGVLSSYSISVINLALYNIDNLLPQEFDYLFYIFMSNLQNPTCKTLLAPLSSTPSPRRTVISHNTIDSLYSAYIEYMLSYCENVPLSSSFIFYVLTHFTNITKAQTEDLIDLLFFDSENNIITDFYSWIPNHSLIHRKEYFVYLFEYLQKENPQELKTIKSELRKKGFIIE